MRPEGLARQERLRGRDRIDALFAAGAVGKSSLVVARALPNELAYSRIAVIVGRKSGKAHERNRIRRRLRAAFRTRKGEFPAGYDLLLLARRGVLEADFEALREGLARAVRRATEQIEPRS